MKFVRDPRFILAVCLVLAARPAAGGAEKTSSGTLAKPKPAAESTAAPGATGSVAAPTSTPAPTRTGSGNAAAEPGARTSAKTFQGTSVLTLEPRWQPRGGKVRLSLTTSEEIPSDVKIGVWFRWKMTDESKASKSTEVPATIRLESVTSDKRTVTVVATVPEDLKWPSATGAASASAPGGSSRTASRETQGFGLIPVAAVRLEATGLDEPADLSLDLGITSVPWSVLIALAIAFIALLLVALVAKHRIPDLKNVGSLLRIITSERGYGSLSQFQIMLWTFVVAVSAVYVLSLSGDLIEISGGTLVLLGISGAATIGAAWHTTLSERPPAAPSSGDPVDHPLPPKPGPPAWSDLIMNYVWVREKNDHVKTLDVTRAQMLIFTFVTAAFVLIEVVTTNTIPPIPDGFMTLMGISNGVYVTSKFVR